MSNQKGFTVVELAMVGWILLCLVGVGLVIKVVWHFVAKFW